jgi:hypothetical protein
MLGICLAVTFLLPVSDGQMRQGAAATPVPKDATAT